MADQSFLGCIEHRGGPSFFFSGGGPVFILCLCWPKKTMRYDITAVETEKLHILS